MWICRLSVPSRYDECATLRCTGFPSGQLSPMPGAIIGGHGTPIIQIFITIAAVRRIFARQRYTDQNEQIFFAPLSFPASLHLPLRPFPQLSCTPFTSLHYSDSLIFFSSHSFSSFPPLPTFAHRLVGGLPFLSVPSLHFHLFFAGADLGGWLVTPLARQPISCYYYACDKLFRCRFVPLLEPNPGDATAQEVTFSYYTV